MRSIARRRFVGAAGALAGADSQAVAKVLKAARGCSRSSAAHEEGYS